MPWATNTELFMFIATINSPAITLFICRIHLVCTITINYPIEVLTAILLTLLLLKDIAMSSPFLCMQCNENYMKITLSFQAHEIEQISAIEGT